MNIGSLDSLNPSVRCGLSSKACQIRPIVDAESPDFSAMDRRDQWVAFFGVDSRVSTTIFSTCSAVIDGTRPGRGSSSRPSNRSSRKRLRHLPTVGCETPNRAATSLFGMPSAHSRTIRDRSARACAEDRRRAHRCNCFRSSDVNSSNAFGRPVRAIPHCIIYVALQRRRTLVNGAIYRGDVRTGEGAILVRGVTGTQAVGTEVDSRNRLWVAGGQYGTARVYDAQSGELITPEYQFAPG